MVPNKSNKTTRRNRKNLVIHQYIPSPPSTKDQEGEKFVPTVSSSGSLDSLTYYKKTSTTSRGSYLVKKVIVLSIPINCAILLLYLLDINGFNTPKVCSSCKTKYLRYFLNANDRPILSILVCNSYNVFWNRDIMAGKNMYYIVQEIWSGNYRLEIFIPQPRSRTTATRTTATQSVTMNVVVPHSSGRT
ncbi:hypothetical protein J3Q64DRAFT_1817306 [Phycomyces blakesleeanus]|uniref:Uncharacterized protein n=2 Tax=Phycomyces blakesleeanus TaxID=4837 RepID=A0A167K6A8_PHYB8|nr:hypothetical protein PHYBLDRAFT_174398 [Phycomyces blakesleeanus NRRL 1555(-)]OAD67360.1 hypothetical protein PHYBLDRAFT_174398 [Phycomyces blakesleeanus NRRL 1555(-)]|eukprot:XP_018285400.1 hypothetical protein PHYBLDRAFT_174398 [Phycomyces blakesleeanus NRRL 1555(-)]